jgi:hypothetical protein
MDGGNSNINIREEILSNKPRWMKPEIQKAHIYSLLLNAA